MDEFLSLLRKSNLLTPEQWKIVRLEAAGASTDAESGNPATDRAAPISPNPTDLTRKLVQRGFITPWQAEWLLQGKKTFTVGKYKLLDCIGRGGMGVVFKALHGEMGRVVALKIMSADVMQNREAVARFRKEIQAVAALDDPHIVAAYDAGSVGGVTYLVMEFVQGHDLGYLLKEEGPLPIEWACECIRQAALALQYAHEKGMVHRDIKPTNVLVAKDPEADRPLVKILDLGLPRFVSETVSADAPGSGKGADDASLTQYGQLLGSPDYIAPEQGKDTRLADIRSDIFSLGCTLFRVLTGELPFAGETIIQKLEARETTDAVRLKDVRPDVPTELDAVVARMLARDPKRRYQTPREVAQALAPFARQFAPIPVRSPQRPAPGARGKHRVGEDTRLEELFKSLAKVETEHSLSVAGITTRLRRVSPHVWLVATGLVLVVSAALFAWNRYSAAEVLVDWPIGEREGGELQVNQRPVKFSKGPKLVVSGRPGTWELRLERDGFETIEKTLTLSRGERMDFVPEWRPTLRTQKRARLRKLEDRAAEAAKLDVLSPSAIAMRTELLSFLQEYPTSHEAHAARANCWRVCGGRWICSMAGESRRMRYFLLQTAVLRNHRCIRSACSATAD